MYLVDTPTTAHARRMLRARTLDLSTRLARIDEGACVALVNIEHPAPIDLIVLRPHAIIVGVFREASGPLALVHNHPWLLEARRARDAAVRHILEGSRDEAAPKPPTTHIMLGTPIAALIMTPDVRADSRIALDIEDHRQRIKVLGFGELAPLASMLQAGARLDEKVMEQIVALFGGRLWAEQNRFLFEIGSVGYGLRMVRDNSVFPLVEGTNIIGRRSAPIQHEYRITIGNDDSISADHAILSCAADGRVLLRDTSTNGTQIRAPNGEEQRLHRDEQAIAPGSMIRIGETTLRLEPTNTEI